MTIEEVIFNSKGNLATAMIGGGLLSVIGDILVNEMNIPILVCPTSLFDCQFMFLSCLYLLYFPSFYIFLNLREWRQLLYRYWGSNGEYGQRNEKICART